MSKKVLMIVTSNDRLGDSGRTTGVWAEELAIPYLAFIDNGFSVDIASPDGGAVPFDPASVQAKDVQGGPVHRFVNDAEAKRKLAASLKLASQDIDGYEALFFPGGHGTMWDLPTDLSVKRAVEQACAAGKVIGAVCHGIAGLLSARDKDRHSILNGKRVNCFTNEEEIAAGMGRIVPFMLESRVIELGARFEKAAMWQPFSVSDGQLVTGQNPNSSALVAKEVMRVLADAAQPLAV